MSNIEMKTEQDKWDAFLEAYKDVQTKYERLMQLTSDLMNVVDDIDNEYSKRFYAITGKVLEHGKS